MMRGLNIAEADGTPLSEIRRRLVRLMAEEKATFDRMLRDAATLGTRYLDAEEGERKVVVEGTANIMNHPELADIETMRRLFETFEEKHRLVQLLLLCEDGGEVDQRGEIVGIAAQHPAELDRGLGEETVADEEAGSFFKRECLNLLLGDPHRRRVN